jgi:hypothetical protein
MVLSDVGLVFGLFLAAKPQSIAVVKFLSRAIVQQVAVIT